MTDAIFVIYPAKNILEVRQQNEALKTIADVGEKSFFIEICLK